MILSYYECNFDLKNNSDSNAIESYACTSEYCLYCRNSQCCLILQRRPTRHLWEAWYFWLGVALLAVFLIFLVSMIKMNWTLVEYTLNTRMQHRRMYCTQGVYFLEKMEISEIFFVLGKVSQIFVEFTETWGIIKEFSLIFLLLYKQSTDK